MQFDAHLLDLGGLNDAQLRRLRSATHGLLGTHGERLGALEEVRALRTEQTAASHPPYYIAQDDGVAPYWVVWDDRHTPHRRVMETTVKDEAAACCVGLNRWTAWK